MFGNGVTNAAAVEAAGMESYDDGAEPLDVLDN